MSETVPTVALSPSPQAGAPDPSRGATGDRAEAGRVDGAGAVPRAAEELDALYRWAPVGLALLDGSLRFLRVNERFAAIHGVPVDAHPGHPLAELLPTLAAAHGDAIREVLSGGRPTGALRAHGLDPREGGRTFAVRWLPVRGVDGAVAGVSAVVEETTALDASERRVRQFEQLVEQSDDFIGLADLDGRLRYLNASARRMVGADDPGPDGLLSMRDYVAPESRAFFDGTFMPEVRARGACRAEMRLAHLRTGARIDVQRSVFVVRDPATGVPIGYGSVTRDVGDALRARDALERERRLLRTVLDELPVGVLVVDAGGRAQLFNRALEGLWRGARPLDGFDAYRQYDAWDPDTGEPIGPADWPISKAVATGERQAPRAIAFRRFDGSVGRMESTAAPLRDGDGRVILAVAVAQDVTERHAARARLERRERELATIADNAPAIIARFDRALRHVFANRAIEALWGRPATECLGRTNRELGFPDALCECWDAATRAVFETGEPQRLEFEWPSADGARWFQGVRLPEFDEQGRVDTVLTVLHDVTELRRSTAALREADRRKDEFIAMLAHELRNPLAPIVNAVRLLERTESLGFDGQRAVGMISRQLAQVRRLVDDLLEVSRISRGRIALRPEPMRLEHAIRDAVEAGAAACDGKRQTLEVGLPTGGLRVVADPVRIAQVLENLLSNACRYTPDGGSIRLEAAGDDDRVEVRVTDDGIGLAAEDLERVFGLFVQAAPGVGDHQGGLGIGLALSRRLAELHGGTLHAESDGPGRGACFVLRLPRVVPDAD